jgi:hypothetical protein
MPALEQMVTALRKADEAGNVDDAQRIAQMIRGYQERQQVATEADQQPPFPVPDPVVSQPTLLQFAQPSSPLASSLLATPGGLGFLAQARVPDNLQEAAASGVDITTGLQTGRGRISLAPNQAYEAEALRSVLTQKFGKEVPVRAGEKSGMLEFVNPETGRWTTIDEFGFSKGDLKDMLGIGASIAGPTAAALGVAAAGGSALPISAGAGLGAFLTEMGKMKLGEKLDVHSMDDEEMLRRAATAGFGEAALSYGAEKLVRLGQLVKKAWSPRPLSQREAERLLEDMESAAAEIESLRARLGPDFQPSIPQQIGSPSFQGDLAATGRINPDVRMDMEQTAAGTQRAIDKYAREVMQPAERDIEQVGQTIVNEARMTREAQASVRQAEQEATLRPFSQIVADLPEVSMTEAGQRARQILVQERQRLDALEDQAWQNYESVIRLDRTNSSSAHANVPLSDEARRLFRGMNNEQRKALFAFEQRQLGQAMPAGISDDADLATATFDLANIDGSIRRIRNVIRDKERGQIATDLSTRDLNRARDALVKSRAAYLREHDPEALMALEAAEAASRLKQTTVDKSILGQILVKHGDHYAKSDTDVFRMIFADRDIEAARQLASIASGNPSQALALRQAVWSIYRREFTENGLPTQALHREFLKQYGEVAEQFFKPNDRINITRFGGMADIVEEEMKRTAGYNKRLDQIFGPLEDKTPEHIVSMAFTKGASANQMRKLRDLADSAGTFEPMREAFGHHMINNLNVLRSPEKLKAVLNKHGPNITGLMGPEYVKDLRTLQRAMEVAAVRGGERQGHQQTLMALMNANLRIFFRPLSRAGLGRTAFLQSRGYIVENVMHEILTDPVKLRAYVALKDQQLTNARVVQFMAIVGGASLLDETQTGVETTRDVIGVGAEPMRGAMQ